MMWSVGMAAMSLICNVLLSLYLAYSTRRLAKDQELKDTQQALATLEERVNNLPDYEDIGEIRADIRGLQSDVTHITKMVESVEKTVTRINDFLLNNK